MNCSIDDIDNGGSAVFTRLLGIDSDSMLEARLGAIGKITGIRLGVQIGE